MVLLCLINEIFRLFTDNAELNAGIGGFIIGGGVALLGAHLLSENEKAEKRKKCRGHHRVRRDADDDEVESRYVQHNSLA